MIGKYILRYKKWQKNIPLVSPFVIGCGVIAVVYFFYRIVLIVSPAVILERAAFKPVVGTNAVCSEDEKGLLRDPQPVLSASYQRRIHDQPQLTPNLVENPDLTKTNSKTGQSIGYSHTIENSHTQYSLLQDSGKRFLRVHSKKDTPSNAVPPAWQIDPVTIKPDRTYAYSFWYRSDVPVNISAEYTVDGETRYLGVTTLKPTTSWQQFAAHFYNEEEASRFRFDLSSRATGQIDTRSFDIHQIPDAQLDTGLATIAFDDGWQSVNDKALALLNKYQIRTTQYIISDVAERGAYGYMNFGTIRNLKKSGHEIGSHSVAHCDQTTLSPAELRRNSEASKQTLERQGLGPIKSFAYPLGQYNGRTQTIYEEKYPLIRSSDFGYNDRYFDETNIRSIGILNTTSDKEFQTWLDHARSHRTWIVLVYHQIDAQGEYNITNAQLEKQLRMVVSSGLKVLPLSEAAAYIRR